MVLIALIYMKFSNVIPRFCNYNSAEGGRASGTIPGSDLRNSALWYHSHFEDTAQWEAW